MIGDRIGEIVDRLSDCDIGRRRFAGTGCYTGQHPEENQACGAVTQISGRPFVTASSHPECRA